VKDCDLQEIFERYTNNQQFIAYFEERLLQIEANKNNVNKA